jgi:predicted AlkP superfamily pyrophosphatase or phosphodiesterase
MPEVRSLAAALLGVAALHAFAPVAEGATGSSQPRLVLQITVDQLRGDMLPRYRDRLGSGGFRLLLDRGVYYANAHYETANTITCSGHAVLVTGADVVQHGIVGNAWFDREKGKDVYCVDDNRYPPVGEPRRGEGGMSPALLTSSTVGDELVMASAGRSRAFAVSGKDRSAIVPGGHLGKAYWYSSRTGGMATSTYYYDALPEWVTAWNGQRLFTRYRESGWTLRYPLEQYVHAAGADNPFAHPNATVGRSFPHRLDVPDDKLASALRFTPFVDELTADFAQELIRQERLGGNGVTDYLSISFSATDYIGHTYGPNSLEAEDNLLRLDATLARLFAFVDKQVGLRNTVIVLSADHGAADIPEVLASSGFHADRFGGEPLRNSVNAAMKKRFGTTHDLVASLTPPGVYLNRSAVAAAGLELAAVEKAVAEFLSEQPGVAFAFTRSDLLAGRLTNTPLSVSVQRAFHPQRSGDVIIIQKQFWYFGEGLGYYASMHGSPYRYDTHVPILLLAPGLKAATVQAPVSPQQIAPTLAAMLGINPPSGCVCAPPLPGAFAH